MKELAYLNKYFLKYRWQLIIGIAFVLISNWFRVKQPQVVREALDYVKLNYDATNAGAPHDDATLISHNLLWYGGSILLYALLMGVFMFFMRQTIIVMSRKIEYDLRNAIFAHYEKLNLSFYKKNKTGDFMSRITEDVNKVRMYLGPAILYAANLVGAFVLTLAAMLSVSPTLTFYALIPLPLLSLSIYYVSRMINRRSEAVQKQLAVLNSVAQESFSGVRVTKAYVQEEATGDYFNKECDTYREKSLNLAKIDSLFFPIMLILIGISTLLIVYVGGNMAAQGQGVTFGNIGEFIIYITMLTFPFTAIGWIASIVQSASASQKRINEFLQTQPEIDHNFDDTSAVQGAIAFDNVTFTYPDTGITAIKNVSFEIKPGETVAIVGRTGSGKSTMADLLLRMYDVSEGSIKVDGIDIRKRSLSQLRKNIGYVPQDVFLFSDSVTQNILFGNTSATEDQAKEYARYAAVYDDMMGLQEGFETVVGERGVTLSGGQKQRLSIARALIKNPSIVLLDDCLSAVDANTEHQIAETLKTQCAGKTTLVITHRIYTSLVFDKIIVLNHGEIAEFGSPEELFAQKGYYYEMVEQQRAEEVS